MLTKCYECQAEISDAADKCPHCGASQSKRAKALHAKKVADAAKAAYAQTPEGRAKSKRKKLVLLGVLGGFSALVVGSCVANAPATKSHAEKVAAYEWKPITKENNEKLFNLFGADGTTRVNAAAPKAAEYAAKSNSCDSVQGVEVLADKSNKNFAMFGVTCANQQRFEFTEGSIDEKNPPLSVQQTDAKVKKELESANAQLTNLTANLCLEATKLSLKFPSSFNQKGSSSGAVKGKNGVFRATIDFEAKNGFGNVIPQTATCVYDANKKKLTTFELSNR